MTENIVLNKGHVLKMIPQKCPLLVQFQDTTYVLFVVVLYTIQNNKNINYCMMGTYFHHDDCIQY